MSKYDKNSKSTSDKIDDQIQNVRWLKLHYQHWLAAKLSKNDWQLLAAMATVLTLRPWQGRAPASSGTCHLSAHCHLLAQLGKVVMLGGSCYYQMAVKLGGNWAGCENHDVFPAKYTKNIFTIIVAILANCMELLKIHGIPRWK